MRELYKDDVFLEWAETQYFFDPDEFHGAKMGWQAASAHLREPVRALYFAAIWHPDRPCNEKGLWTAVRDAFRFTPGESSKLLGPDRTHEPMACGHPSVCWYAPAVSDPDTPGKCLACESDDQAAAEAKARDGALVEVEELLKNTWDVIHRLRGVK